MRIFKTRWFARYARHERIPDASLKDAIERVAKGLVDADLGGGLIKQRVAREGRGRSAGYRMIIAYRAGHRAFFLFGFAKSDRENLSEEELATARTIGAKWFAADAEGIAHGIAESEIQEIL